MLMWHQHQPFYPKNSEGVFTRPWVRLHATKDYLDMVEMLEGYPEVTATFNLTPVLLLQLEELADGVKDTYWVATEIPAEDLSEDDKTFIAERFFDVNPGIVARFPRLQEMADERTARGVDGVVASWDSDDFRDLQVLFNLAWTDPDYLGEEPLASLVAKKSGYAEDDKHVVLSEHQRIVEEVIPAHSRLWDEGRIEVTTTPLAHPILPLLTDTNLAVAGDPSAVLPSNRYREVGDADMQIALGLATAERMLGRAPTGVWPGEGSVAQEVMNLFSKNGVAWVATGEDVLAKTLDIGSFERDGDDTVVDAATLYRAYSAQVTQRDPVAMFFRDTRLSDQIGFEYSGMDGVDAANDFMTRLRAIYERVDPEEEPVVVPVILDGENAWEHYENDGKDFLHALYDRLGSADWVETVTPTDFLEQFGAPSEITDVFPASWFQPNFATWIGEEEEATAWDYLYRTRQDLRRAEQGGEVSAAQLEDANRTMLFAEGSDWFWWYGSDQESGDDDYFDRAFRELLGQVYDSIGQERPAFVAVPIIPETPLVADRSTDRLATIVVDGEQENAWESAGSYAGPGVSWIFDKENLYIGLDKNQGIDEIYLGAPQGAKSATTSAGQVLGFGATDLVVLTEGRAVLCNPLLAIEDQDCDSLESATGEITEIAIPIVELGAIEAGDVVSVRLASLDTVVPEGGPMAFQVPDISDVTVFLDVTDPEGDDHGPGSYVYPTDGVFGPGAFDLTRFTVGTEDDDIVFAFEVESSIGNPWGSPSGLSLQTFDVYIDTDPGAATGARTLIAGRNAALGADDGWEFGITIEGWQPGLYVVSEDGSIEETEPSFPVVVFGDQGRVVVKVPVALLSDTDPTTWGYAAVLLSQEGFPSPGVRRVRDIEAVAAQWRGGGAPNDLNHPRIYDVAWPGTGIQEDALSDYPAVTSGAVDELASDQFAVLPLLSQEGS